MGKASWVTNDHEIDPAFMEWGARQPRRISTELIQPLSVTVPHLPWVTDDDDIIAKMRKRGILSSDSEDKSGDGGI